MNYTQREVLEFIEENDVKFVKLAFCDVLGNLKNISIMAHELPKAFEQGISFDASAIKGFMNVEESDLFLHPDLKTLTILPWRPQHGRVIRFFCEIKKPDGTPFVGDTRVILKKALEKAKEQGYECKIGPECEFYLFELDEKGYPTKTPHDEAGYCDVAPLDRGENIRREICLTLEEMGIKPESSHHEQGPGQNEIDFKYSEALEAADQLITFRNVVKTIAARNGLYASFMPKPLKGYSGNGLHINVSLSKEGVNIFKNEVDVHSKEAESFIQGILEHVDEMTAFTNPITNSYKRLGAYEAPLYITWSHQNRSQLIRIPAATGENTRMELRSADPACNPYLVFALLIYAGLQGISEEKVLCKPLDVNIYKAEEAVLNGFEKLPGNLDEALRCAEASSFIKQYIPIELLNKYITIKDEEWKRYIEADNQETEEEMMYFKII